MFWVLFWGIAAAIDIVDWVLPNEEKRKELTHLYLQEHYTGNLTGELEKDVLMEPRLIVLHWTGSATARSTWNTFSSAYLSGRKDIQKGGALNVGAHFLVDRDGTIYRLLDEKRIARHCIGLNHVAIGIENVGGGKNYPLTSAQLEANVALIQYLSTRYPLTHLIGHYEVGAMEGHTYFSEKDPRYRSIKPDPGASFMRAVRQKMVERGVLLQAPHQDKND